MNRWPAEPLLRLAELRLASSVDDHAPEWHAPDAHLAALFGVSVRSILSWRDRGMSDMQADRYANRLNLHPVEVWPDFDELSDDEVDDLESMPELPRCAEPGCNNPVIPSKNHPNKRYCSKTCRVRAKDRRRRQNPEIRERKNARHRAYYIECRDALLAKQRARDREKSEERKAYKRAYYLANADVLKAKQRERDAAKREAKRVEKWLRRESLGPGWEEVA